MKKQFDDYRQVRWCHITQIKSSGMHNFFILWELGEVLSLTFFGGYKALLEPTSQLISWKLETATQTGWRLRYCIFVDSLAPTRPTLVDPEKVAIRLRVCVSLVAGKQASFSFRSHVISERSLLCCDQIRRAADPQRRGRHCWPECTTRWSFPSSCECTFASRTRGIYASQQSHIMLTNWN